MYPLICISIISDTSKKINLPPNKKQRSFVDFSVFLPVFHWSKKSDIL